MTQSTTKQRCPYCRHALPATYQVAGPPTAGPTPGAVAVCPYCTETCVFDENTVLRKATETELEELELSEEYRVIRTRSRRAARAHGSIPALPEGEEEEREDPFIQVISLLVGTDGQLDWEQIPQEVRQELMPLLRKVRLAMVSDDIRKHVSPEIANHVLSAYGNEQASMPNVAVGALISLIRLCNEMDDHLLASLDDAEGIHGYVLAVTMLAEHPPGGVEMLEVIAGLRDAQEWLAKDV